jgi:DNA-binding NtrC family response regulator
METVAVRRVCIPLGSRSIADGRQYAPSVLVAVEDENVRAAAGRVLGRAGYRVLTARHSGHALLACLTGGRIDILVSELRTVADSGPALAERLRRHNPDLRVIYLSDDRRDASRDVLVRPVTADDLLQAIDRASREQDR